MKREYENPCVITANTHHPSGKRRRIDALIEGGKNPVKATCEFISKKKEAWLWLGVEISIIDHEFREHKFVYEKKE